MNKEKTIKEFVDDFRKAFDFDLVDGVLVPNGNKIEFKAMHLIDDRIGASSGWVETATPRLEISGEDYRRLGDMSTRSPMPSAGVISGLMKIVRREQ